LCATAVSGSQHMQTLCNGSQRHFAAAKLALFSGNHAACSGNRALCLRQFCSCPRHSTVNPQLQQRQCDHSAAIVNQAAAVLLVSAAVLLALCGSPIYLLRQFSRPLRHYHRYSINVQQLRARRHPAVCPSTSLIQLHCRCPGFPAPLTTPP
jgi:hypothetical protein